MSKALRAIVERLGDQQGVLLCAILLDHPHPLADGHDVDGRSIFLIGRHLLGDTPEAKMIVGDVLSQMKEGYVPDCVHAVAFGPDASRGITTMTDAGSIEEVLLHGPRGTGKTHALAGAACINMELHARAEFPLPFKVSWLHDSLVSAKAKTAESLKLPMWGGLWTIKEDGTRPIFTLSGKELIRGEFLGCRDEASAERLRQDCHMVVAEELVASMSDGLGIKQEEWELARSSAIRLETRRRAAGAATNPGSPDLWPVPYFGVIGPTPPKRLAVRIDITDRMTPEQQQVHRDTFAGTSSMHRRLGRGEWVMSELGSPVAEGFDSTIHVAKEPLLIDGRSYLAIGWDGGHSPSAVIGQNVNGQCRIYAGLNAMGVGVLELIERQVLPWLVTHAPWALNNYGADLVHIIDPNMSTPGQATILETAERMIRKHLGGRVIKGAVRWPPRREAVLKALRPSHIHGKPLLTIAQVDDTATLIAAYESRWYYKMEDGQVDRTGPEKPNSPWADLGDASAYLLDWLQGGELMDRTPRELTVEYSPGWETPVTTVYR